MLLLVIALVVIGTAQLPTIAAEHPNIGCDPAREPFGLGAFQNYRAKQWATPGDNKLFLLLLQCHQL